VRAGLAKNHPDIRQQRRPGGEDEEEVVEDPASLRLRRGAALQESGNSARN
jgi:hypothetical protein